MSISSIKKILLAGTALVAMSAFSLQAHAATDTISAAGTTTLGADPNATPAITFAAGSTTGSIVNDPTGDDYLADGPDTVTNTSGTNNIGTLTLQGVTGTQNVAGAVGTSAGTGSLFAVNAGATGGTSDFAGAVYAETVTIGGGAATFSSTVKTTTLSLGAGTVAAGAVTGNLTFTGAGAATLNGGLAGNIDFAGNNGVINLEGGQSITAGAGAGTVNNTGTAGEGSLILIGGTQTVAGAVGGTNALASVKAATNSGDISNFSSTVNATNIYADEGVLNITGLATGTLTFQNTGAGTANLSGGLAGNIDFATAGTVNVASGESIAAGAGTGAVNSTVSGVGKLDLMGGTQSVAGAVGATDALTEVDAGQSGGATTFDSTVNATTIKVGTGSATFDGNVTSASTINFEDLAGTATVATTATSIGAVNSTGGVSGKLVFTDATQTVNGVVGGTNALTEVDAGQSGGATIFDDAVSATTIKVGTGSATFEGAVAGGLTYTAAGTATVYSGIGLAGAVTGDGAIGSGVGSLTFDGASSGITGISSGGGSTFLHALTLSGSGTTVAVTGAVLAADTTALGNNALTATTTFGIGTGGAQTLDSTVTSASVYGHVTATGAATVGTGTTVDLTLTAPTTTTTYTLVSGTSGTVATLAEGDLKVTIGGTTYTDTGAYTLTHGLVTYSQVAAGDNLEIEASIANTSGVITANDLSVDAALNTITTVDAACVTTACTQLKTAIANVNTQAGISATAAHNALQSLMPAGADGGAQNAALTVGTETQGVANTRLAALRDGDATSGVAAGASSHGVSMWLEGYGQHANQDTMDGVNGYGATTWGGAVGVDSSAMFDKAIVGVAINYGSSVVNSSDINTTTTDLGNYGINLYGTYDLGQKMFVNGQVGFAYNTIDSTRHNAGGSGLNADGSTSSDQYSARVDAGRDYPVQGGMTLTPDVSAAYTYLNTAGYTETGAGGDDNTVASNGQNALGLGIGGTAAWKIHGQDDDVFKPSLHAGYTYEAIDDKVQTSSSFVGDPASTIFINEGASPARSIFDVGAKVVYSTKANWDFSANYDFQAKEDYTSNTGELRATAHF